MNLHLFQFFDTHCATAHNEKSPTFQPPKSNYEGLFSSPYRAVQALLNGARDMESVNVARFQNLMKNVQSGNVPGAAQSSYIPIPVPVKQQQQTADPVDEIMRKLFLRKIIDKFSEKDRGEFQMIVYLRH